MKQNTICTHADTITKKRNVFNLHLKVIIVSQLRILNGIEFQAVAAMGYWSSRTHANSYSSHLVAIPTHTQVIERSIKLKGHTGLSARSELVKLIVHYM